MDDATLQKLVQKAEEALEKLTPEQKAAHWKAQQESWVRGQIGLIPTDRELARKRGFSGD